MAYIDEPAAYLVAGRKLDARFSDEGFDKFCDSLEELGAELERQLVVVPAGSFVAGDDVSAAGQVNCALGLLIGSADTDRVTPLAYGELVSGVARATALPWDRIAGIVAGSQDDGPRELGGDAGLYATAAGPLAGVILGYGVRVTLYAEGERRDPDVDDEKRFLADPAGPADTAPGLDIVRGTLMDQSGQPDAVYGVEVTRALFGDIGPVQVDVSEAAHAGRVRSLGELAAQSAYHLIANYD